MEWGEAEERFEMLIIVESDDFARCILDNVRHGEPCAPMAAAFSQSKRATHHVCARVCVYKLMASLPINHNDFSHLSGFTLNFVFKSERGDFSLDAEKPFSTQLV